MYVINDCVELYVPLGDFKDLCENLRRSDDEQDGDECDGAANRRQHDVSPDPKLIRPVDASRLDELARNAIQGGEEMMNDQPTLSRCSGAI